MLITDIEGGNLCNLPITVSGNTVCTQLVTKIDTTSLLLL